MKYLALSILFLLLCGLSPPLVAQAQPGYYAGANYAWQNYNLDFTRSAVGPTMNHAQVDTDFNALSQQRVSHMTWWLLGGDGRNALNMDASGNVSVDATFLDSLNYAMTVAAKNHIKLNLALATSGMLQNDWANGYFANIVYQTRPSYMNNVVKVIAQTINTSPNKASVEMITAGVELDWNVSGLGNNWPWYPLDSVRSFINDTADVLHTYCPGVPVSIDCAGPPWLTAWNGLHVDRYAVNYYNWGDTNGLWGSGLPTAASYGMDKPVGIGEYWTGFADYSIGSADPNSAWGALNTLSQKGYVFSYAWAIYGADWYPFAFPISAWNILHSGPIATPLFPLDIPASSAADTFHSGGRFYSDSAPTVDQSAITDKLDNAKLQGGWYGPQVTYTVHGFTPGQSLKLTLWFSEPHEGYVVGSRVFDVSVNGNVILPHYDIMSKAGSMNKAVEEHVSVAADANGDIVLSLTGVAGAPDTNAYLCYARLS